MTNFFSIGIIFSQKFDLDKINFFSSEKKYSRKKIQLSFPDIPNYNLLDYIKKEFKK